MRMYRRRSVVVALFGLLTSAAVATPASAEVGAVSVVFTKGGLIVGVGGGQGVLVFRGKRYPFTVSGMSVGFTIGASTTKSDRKTIAAMDLDLRRRLAADGWLAGHEEYRSEDDQALHGGATRGPEGDMWLKDGAILDIENKRMDDPAAGEDAASAGEWIQVISLWTHDDYPWIERYAFAPPAPETLQ